MKYRSEHIRLLLMGVLIALMALVTIPNPVVQASGHTSSSSSAYSTHYNYDPNDPVTCNEFHYLNGIWPARFHFGGCMINDIKLHGVWDVRILAVIAAGLVEDPLIAITVGVVAVLAEIQIDDIYSKSNSCGGGGVYVDIYAGVPNFNPVC